MKYNEKKRWVVDMGIISDDSNLDAAQVEYCVGELCKAIGAPADVKPASVSEDDNDDGDGEANGIYGGLFYATDEHRFHKVELWADEKSDLKAIMQIVCAMCREGCIAVCRDGYEREDYFLNFGYKLKRVNK